MTRFRPHALTVLFVFLIAGLAWNWFETARLDIRLYNPLPVWDYWRVPIDLTRYPTYGLRCLWVQHNEHRILWQELVFLADAVLFRGRQILPLAASFLCYLGTWWVLAWAISKDGALPLGVRAMGVLLAGIIIGWKGSVAVLASPFQLQWTLAELAMVLAFACLARLFITGKTVYLALMIVFATVATYSSSNGLLLWPVLIAAALLLRLRARQVVTLSVAAVVFDGLFFVGYQFTGGLHVSNLLAHPIYSVQFVGSYLSMPFGGMKGPEFGALLGIANMVAVAIVAAVALRKRLMASETAIVLFGVWTFTLVSAVMVAAGRMDWNDSGFQGAKPPRYVIVPMIDWAVVVLLCLWITCRLGLRWFSAALLTVIFGVFLAVGFLKLRWWMESVEDQFVNEQMVALSVENGLKDRLLLRKIFPQPEAVMPLIDYLREKHLSVFAGHRYKWLGRPVAAFARKQAAFASAQVAYAFPLNDGLEVVGWADESDQTHPPQWIVLANEKDEIVGFGRKFPAGLPQHLRSPNTAYSLGWVGFVNLSYKVQTYSAYVIERAGLVAISGSFAVPALSSVSPNQVGPVLSGINWQMDSTWTLHGIPEIVNFGVAPAGQVYGSWSGDDRKTGQIVSSAFATPADGCFVLPVLTGPSIRGESAEVVDADTGQVVAAVPVQEGELVWLFWRVALPPATKHVKIVARDGGQGWGQWIGIAEPVQCR